MIGDFGLTRNHVQELVLNGTRLDSQEKRRAWPHIARLISCCTLLPDNLDTGVTKDLVGFLFGLRHDVRGDLSEVENQNRKSRSSNFRFRLWGRQSAYVLCRRAWCCLTRDAF